MEREHFQKLNCSIGAQKSAINKKNSFVSNFEFSVQSRVVACFCHHEGSHQLQEHHSCSKCARGKRQKKKQEVHCIVFGVFQKSRFARKLVGCIEVSSFVEKLFFFFFFFFSSFSIVTLCVHSFGR